MMDEFTTVASVIGTQAIVIFAISKAAVLLSQMLDKQTARQQQWLNVQKELELARIAQGTNLLGPKEIRVKPASMLDGLLVPEQR